MSSKFQYEETEEALSQSEERFRSLTESTSDIIWEVDCNLIYTYVSPKTSDMLGYTPEELIGKYAPDFIVPEAQDRLGEQLKAFIKSERPFYRWDNKMLHKDGSVVTMETSAIPFFDTSGQLLGYRGIDRDITARKQAEEALSQSEERFRSLTENTSDIIWEIDPNGNYTYINPKVKDVLGYEPAELIGRSAYDFLAPGKRYSTPERLRGFIKSRKTFSGWVNARWHKDGSSVIMETSGVPFFDNDGQLLGYRGINRDITERERLRENMEFYRREVARVQEEERKRIARELHDETAQALAGVSMEIGQIILSGREYPQEAMQRLVEIPDRIGSIVEEVRRFSYDLRPGLLDRFGLEASLEVLVNDTRLQYGLDCTFEIVGSARSVTPESELALFRTAQEALHNITKHAKATEAVVLLTYGKGKTKVDITDSGEGFEIPSVLSGLARSRKLGLISINERMQLLGGCFSVTSELGKGTTISAEIPR